MPAVSRSRLIWRWSFAIVLCCASGAALAQQKSSRQVVMTARASPTAPYSPAVKAGDLIYLSGTLATDEKGTVSGDIQAQTKRALDNLGVVLKAAGVGFADVVSTQVYLKNPADVQPMNAIYRARWPKDPPARTTVVVEDFVRPNALIEINMIAARSGVSRKAILPAGWAAPSEPFSYGVKAGDTLFVSGLVARNGKDNSVVAGDVKVQTKAVMDNIGAVLKAADMDFPDAAIGRIWVADSKIFQDMNSVYRTFYQKDLPARATLKARFENAQDLVQISMVAIKGAARQPVEAAPTADGTPGRPNPNYSAGLAAAGRMYITGMTGSTPDNAGDMKAQTREALARMSRTLKAGGFGPSDVVDVNVYVNDASKFEAMNERYRESFAKDLPARTTVQAAGVGTALVEIVMTAAR
jgi:reactive intermediate/imine deaminase